MAPCFECFVSLLLWTAACFVSGKSEPSNAKEKPNVLFLMSDDLRPELSIYGRKHVISPNFERLANRGVVFDLAYSQLPVCFPSRHSMLTSMRPDTTGILTWTDAQLPYLDNLMTVLVRNNYNSAGVGKLFHHPHTHKSEYTHGRWDGKYETTYFFTTACIVNVLVSFVSFLKVD